MALERVLLGGQNILINTDTGRIAVTTDSDIDIGDVHLLDLTDTKINPATKENQLTLIAQGAPLAISETGDAGSGSLATIGSAVVLGGKTELALTIKNTSDTTLSNFTLDVQAGTGDDWFTLLTGDDWVNKVTSVLRASGSSATVQYANTLAAGEHVVAILDVGPMYAIRFQAQSTAASKSVAVTGTAG
jgi:hypothetical protein